MSEKRIIEINGAKVEVDMRHAKRIDTFRIGSRVKVLVKDRYSSRPSIHSGVIVGFDDFKSAPTINVAYVENSYSPDIKFIAINTLANTEDTTYEIVADYDNSMMVSKADVLQTLNSQINRKVEEIREIGRKKRIFLSRFGHTFGETREEIREQLEQDRNDETQAISAVLAESNELVAEIN